GVVDVVVSDAVVVDNVTAVDVEEGVDVVVSDVVVVDDVE
ncbi:unnamed protein product, partial [Rotaria sp. Silwood2]